MNYALHIIRNPAGTVSYVGTVPVALASAIPASRSALLGGRAWQSADGAYMEWKFPVFATAAEARAHAETHGVRVCESPTCACANV